MKALIYFTLGFILFSCNAKKSQNEKPKDTSSNKNISATALEYGNIISKETKKTLGSNLIKAIDEGGVAHAITFCNVHAYPLVDSLEKKFNAKIKRASRRSRNPDDMPTDYELKVIEEFQAMMVDGTIAKPKVEFVNDNTLIYTKPIILDNQVCLNCHGIPGEQISQENLDLIKNLYPEDYAIGYKIGELRGIWSISFSKDHLVNMAKSK